MAVISKLDFNGQDITRYNNATIKNINFNGVDYHFAKSNEVSGKNLFDRDNPNIFIGTMLNGKFALREDRVIIYIPCERNMTYSISRLSGNAFMVCCSVERPADGVSYLNEDGTSSWVDFTSSVSVGTYTTNNIANWLAVSVYGASNKYSAQEIMDSLQIEKNASATSYETFSGIGNQSRTCKDAVNEPIIDMQIKGNSIQGLPSEYKLLSFLQSNDKQYIDTGFTPNQDTKIYAKFQLTSTGANYPFGVRETSQTNACYVSGGASTWNFRFGKTANTSYGSTDTELHEIEMSKDGIYFDGTLIATPSQVNFTCTGNLYLFATNNNGAVAYGDTILYEFKMWDKGNLIRHYVASARVVDNESGMYDFVNKKLYENQTTTAFIQGEEVKPTAEMPLEIKSVGEKTKNLIDVSKAETGSLVGADGSDFASNNRARTPFVYVKKGTYTISMNSDVKATTMFFYSQPASSGYFISKYATSPVVKNGIRVANFPVEQDCYLRCVFVPEDESKTTDLSAETLKNYNPMIEEVPNLFDKNKVDTTKHLTDMMSAFNTASVNTYNCSDFIEVEPNTRYRKTGSLNSRVQAYFDENKNFIEPASLVSIGAIFTTPSNCKYLVFNLYVPNAPYDDVRLERVDATDYEPYGYKMPIKINDTTKNIYLKEPLRKIGKYVDVLDYKNKRVVRRIASEFLTEVQHVSGDASTYKKFLTDIKYKPLLTGASVEAKGYAISNKFKQSNVMYKEMGNYANIIQTYITTGGVNRCVYTFGDSSVKTTAEAQPLIADGFEICYVMADTIEETIEVPEISTLDGTTTFEIVTQLEPSGLSVKYWKQI